MKKIAILGSTGSIGTQTLQVVEEQKDIQVTALAAGRNRFADTIRLWCVSGMRRRQRS